jgi:hypothetical protein
MNKQVKSLLGLIDLIISVGLLGTLLFSCQFERKPQEQTNVYKSDWKIDSVRWFAYATHHLYNFKCPDLLDTADIFKVNIHVEDRGKTFGSIDGGDVKEYKEVNEDVSYNVFFYNKNDTFPCIPCTYDYNSYFSTFYMDTVNRNILMRSFNYSVVAINPVLNTIDSGVHFHPSLYDTSRFKPQFYYERDAFIHFLKQNQSKMNKKSWLYQEAVRRGIFKE